MSYIAGANRTTDTGDTYFTEIAKSTISGAKEARHKLKRALLEHIPIIDTKPLDTRIEYARYIVDCPNCGNTEFAFEDRLFLCSACNNSDIQGQLRKVKFPNQRERIEDLLGKRQAENRHWFPIETIEDLENENKSHGLGV